MTPKTGKPPFHDGGFPAKLTNPRDVLLCLASQRTSLPFAAPAPDVICRVQEQYSTQWAGLPYNRDQRTRFRPECRRLNPAGVRAHSPQRREKSKAASPESVPSVPFSSSPLLISRATPPPREQFPAQHGRRHISGYNIARSISWNKGSLPFLIMTLHRIFLSPVHTLRSCGEHHQQHQHAQKADMQLHRHRLTAHFPIRHESPSALPDSVVRKS